jgi:hypothetical protein
MAAAASRTANKDPHDRAAPLAAYRKHLDSFLRGLSEIGFAAGTNVEIEYRWAEGDYDRL